MRSFPLAHKQGYYSLVYSAKIYVMNAKFYFGREFNAPIIKLIKLMALINFCALSSNTFNISKDCIGK